MIANLWESFQPLRPVGGFDWRRQIHRRRIAVKDCLSLSVAVLLVVSAVTILLN